MPTKELKNIKIESNKKTIKKGAKMRLPTAVAKERGIPHHNRNGQLT
jgi:hypothetical protein